MLARPQRNAVRDTISAEKNLRANELVKDTEYLAKRAWPAFLVLLA